MGSPSKENPASATTNADHGGINLLDSGFDLLGVNSGNQPAANNNGQMDLLSSVMGGSTDLLGSGT